MQIYGDVRSGNCYKLKLLCALLDIEHDWIPVDIMQGETRTESFLAMNPAGQIPLCVTADGEVLTQSNAILYYLGQGSRFWPGETLAQARVLEWQFFEQYSHEPGVAVARFIKHAEGSMPWIDGNTGQRMNLAVPFLENGRNVYDHAGDQADRWGGSPPPAGS